MNYAAIPLELRERPQWICWRYEQTNGAKPTKVPYDANTGYRADITNRVCWSSFDITVSQVEKYNYSGIGFCLSRDDPYCGIDLDDPNNDPEIINSHDFILKQFAGTYAEISPSGMGVHIIGKGYVPTACKRHKVEIYPFDRYLTVTGDVINSSPISDVQQLLWQLYNDMGGNKAAKIVDIPDNPEAYNDEAVVTRASQAENGELFKRLWAGDWTGYPSQSEADLALVDYLQFHSGNVEQIVRLFRASGLGQREKANRNDYVYGMVAKSFDRARMVELPPSQEFIERYNAEIRSWSNEQQTTEKPRPFVDMLPSGLVSDIASYIYKSAPYPLAEAAILGGMALVDGIAGRTYNVSGDVGLNQYLLLLATSGTGKESMKDGIGRLLNALGEKAHGFMGPGHIASGQAINKWMAAQQRFCVLSILPEFGPTMRSLAFARPGSNEDVLRGFLLKLYTANGRGKLLGESAYSDQSKNAVPLPSPSFTLLTEAEPEGFYRSFDKEMISSGLIPRFTMVEYTGPLPELNLNRQLGIDPFLVNRLIQLCDIIKQLSFNNTVIDVVEEPEAGKMLYDFNKWARQQSFDAEIEFKPLWNRAHIRVYKIAGTLALRDPQKPIITKRDVDFAMAVEQQYITNLLAHAMRGEIGDPNSELRQEQFVYDVLASYIKTNYNDLPEHNKKRLSGKMKNDLVVTKAFLQQRTANAAPFKRSSHNYGKSGDDALALVIKKLIEAGELSDPINKLHAYNYYGSKQTMYKIENPRLILDRSSRM